MKRSSAGRRVSAALGIMVLLLSSVCYGAGTLDNFTIIQLEFPSADSGVHLVYSGGTWPSGTPNPDGCTVYTKFVVPYVASDAQRQRAVIAGLLTGYSLGKAMRARVNGCIAGTGGDTYPLVDVLYIKP